MTPRPASPRYLRTAEAAAIFQVSGKTVSRWAKEGKLPFTKTLGGHRRYEERVIRELLAQNTIRPTDAATEVTSP